MSRRTGNRLVARGLEAEWEKCLQRLLLKQSLLAEKRPSSQVTIEEKGKLRALSADLGKVWSASTTTDRIERNC